LALEDIKNIPEEFSFEKEKEIARSFSKRFQWEMILIGVGQATVWLSLWPLVINGYISLFFGSLIATICACFAYLPSHEAQHGNYSRGNPKRRWIDSFVSHFTLITIMFPHDLMRCTHMKHHAYTNNPEKDPDYDTASAKSLWEVIIATQVGIKKYESIAEIFKNDNAFMKSFNKGVIIGMTYRVILLTLVVMFPLETLLLWWLPSKFGIIYLSTFFSWYPHYQADIGRYKDTKFWSHWMPRFLNHSMQLHFVHHLHPGIGHYDEPKAIEALKPFLIARKVPGAEDIPDRVKYNPLIKL
jgi:beta-carotene hydroxylase